ncbi:hypothetical protein [Rhodobacter sp. NTK016B]|uniref:hypothetical protein n=1 Tax=Rhodobacter sp. NTK016B TaxID=2759676 RepID=UPI00257131B1|nr:hypothetical protein [Rhodobacter sp. NTK016B]
MALLQYLFLKSAGVGVGVFLGTMIGLGLRRSKGKTEGLVRGSVALTALVAGLLGLVVMMFITWMGMR